MTGGSVPVRLGVQGEVERQESQGKTGVIGGNELTVQQPCPRVVPEVAFEPVEEGRDVEDASGRGALDALSLPGVAEKGLHLFSELVIQLVRLIRLRSQVWRAHHPFGEREMNARILELVPQNHAIDPM